jgi:hypothetical protein
MIADVVIAAVLLFTLAAACAGLRTGPGHHKAPMLDRPDRPRRVMPARELPPLPERPAVAPPAPPNSPNWAFRPMDVLPATEGGRPWPVSGTGPVKHAGRPALPPPATRPATPPAAAPALPPLPSGSASTATPHSGAASEPEPETGPLSPRRERLRRLPPGAIADLELAGYNAHGGYPDLIADSCFTRADAAIVAGAVSDGG